MNNFVKLHTFHKLNRLAYTQSSAAMSGSPTAPETLAAGSSSPVLPDSALPQSPSADIKIPRDMGGSHFPASPPTNLTHGFTAQSRPFSTSAKRDMPWEEKKGTLVCSIRTL